jgi:hypothetical protein
VSEAALRQFEDAQTALIAALDGADVTAVQSANVALGRAAEALAAVGGWRDRPGLRSELATLMAQADAARGRVNGLADRNRRQLDKLVALSGHVAARSYGRSGKLR